MLRKSRATRAKSNSNPRSICNLLPRLLAISVIFYSWLLKRLICPDLWHFPHFYNVLIAVLMISAAIKAVIKFKPADEISAAQMIEGTVSYAHNKFPDVGNFQIGRIRINKRRARLKTANERTIKKKTDEKRRTERVVGNSKLFAVDFTHILILKVRRGALLPAEEIHDPHSPRTQYLSWRLPFDPLIVDAHIFGCRAILASYLERELLILIARRSPCVRVAVVDVFCERIPDE